MFQFFAGLPENPNFDELDIILNRTRNMKVHPITHIVALLRTVDEVYLIVGFL